MIKPTFSGVLGGFDGTATPKWQTVGRGDVAIVFLSDGDDTEVKVFQKGIIKLEEATNKSGREAANGKSLTQPTPKNLRIFRISGLMSGTAFVEVRRENALVERLEVMVTETIEFKVSFKFVSDNAGHFTKRDASTLNNLIEAANLHLLNNVNIKSQENYHYYQSYQYQSHYDNQDKE